jgi:hypothetical protein
MEETMMIRKMLGGMVVLSLLVAVSPLEGQSKGDANTQKSFDAVEAVSTALSNLGMAVQLAHWGYESESPEALLAAARILVDTHASDEGGRFGEGVSQSFGDAGAETKDAAPLDLDPGQLLADAAAMPGGADLSAAIQRVQATPQPRGAVGGPVFDRVVIDARSTRWFTASFRGGEYARIDVVGDGDTDLDCWLYDENGNLIDSDTDLTDWCILEFLPSWTGSFTLKITNFGYVWNQAIITSN